MALAFDAVILDLDGVTTRTASLHAQAWKTLFDEYREQRAALGQSVFPPFDIDQDYRATVDGKLRDDGTRSFLRSRGVEPSLDLVRELGERKNKYFLELLNRKGPEVFPDAIRAIRRWKLEGVKLAIVSSSKNCASIIERAGLSDLFDTRVDGTHLEKWKLPGKPAPDLYLAAARMLGIQAKRAMVIEDAIAGVQSARHGAFGKVIGVARQGGEEALMAAGADAVVHSLDEISLIDALRERRELWVLRFDRWEPESETLRESLCTLGNGYFATRGAAEESVAGRWHYPATYLAGGYDRLRSVFTDRILESNDLVNWPNWLCLSFLPEGGDWFDLGRLSIESFEQELDFESGVLSRKMRIRDSGGRETDLKSHRIVSMADPHLGAIRWELTPLNWSGKVTVRSGIDGRVSNQGVERYRSLASLHLDPVEAGEFRLASGEKGLSLVMQTRQSHLRVAQAIRTRVFFEDSRMTAKVSDASSWDGARFVGQNFSFDVKPGELFRIEKVVAIYASRDHAVGDPLESARWAIQHAEDFPETIRKHSLKWAQLWRRSDIQMARNPKEQRALRLHIFHLLQTVSIHIIDLDVGVPARGLHGEAYRGHVFWDELFIFPFFNFRIPELSRELLEYRHRRLGEARVLAREEGCSGAMFPWQSANTGCEESPFVHLNPLSGHWVPDYTHLQRHVNSAIVYNIWQYYQVTQDREFLAFHGIEMMLEIARFWASRAVFNPSRGRYEIRGVVGPDEFHTLHPVTGKVGIDNNAYTNFMASWSIDKALYALGLLDQERRAEIREELGISESEISQWDDVSRRLYIPFGDDGIINQFEGYEKLDTLALDEYRRKYGDVQRIDRILEAEGRSIDRYQITKQADVLMLFYLFSTEELIQVFGRLGYVFDPASIPKNILFYVDRTVHGSTLSRAIHSWVLARLDRQGSWELFQGALESDLSDIQGGTTREGIHLGAMAETVDVIQRCYTGMEPRDEVLWFNPLLPDELPSVRLKIRYRGHWLALLITHHEFRISVERSWYEAARIGFDGQVHILREGDYMRFRLKRRPLPGLRASRRAV